jgi:hypothetical protein
LRRLGEDLWIAASGDELVKLGESLRNVKRDNDVVGRNRGPLEAPYDHLLQRVPFIVGVHRAGVAFNAIVRKVGGRLDSGGVIS